MARIILTLLLLGILPACGAPTESATPAESTADTAGTATATTADNTTAQETVATDTEETSTMATDMSAYKDKVAEIKTSKGTITIRFFPEVAPNHVKNFIDLAKSGFYDGTKFHRIIPGFMIQGGDPNTKTANRNSWGTGGSDKELKAEFNSISHKRGIVSMARSNDPDSASSQFFIVVKDSPFLDRNYTVFGQVTSGMEVADAIVQAEKNNSDQPLNPVAIDGVTIRDASDAEKGPAPQ